MVMKFVVVTDEFGTDMKNAQAKMEKLLPGREVHLTSWAIDRKTMEEHSTRCPECGSTDYRTKASESDEGTDWNIQFHQCKECETEWKTDPRHMTEFYQAQRC